MGTKQKGKKTRTKKRKYTKRKSQKGGKKTGQFYTVIKDWKPEHEPPHTCCWSHLEVDSKTPILFLTIGDRVELRSKKKKIDTCIKPFKSDFLESTLRTTLSILHL